MADASASSSTAGDSNARLVWRDLAAGSVGGMAGVVAGHPFDTAKTRLQVLAQFEGTSTWRVMADTARNEGASALYRGMSFPLGNACALTALVFAVQGVTERWLTRALGSDNHWLNGFLGGCVAGLVQSPIVTMVDLVKCQRQVQVAGGGVAGGLPVMGPVAVLQHRVASLGLVQGCLQGLYLCALKECPSYGVYFLIYEQVRRKAEAQSWPVVPTTLLGGGLAGCVSLGILHPVDVVKSRIQTLPVNAAAHERSALTVARAGLASEGTSFFLRGFGAAMQRAFVVNAGTFGGYELAKSAISRP